MHLISRNNNTAFKTLAYWASGNLIFSQIRIYYTSTAVNILSVKRFLGFKVTCYQTISYFPQLSIVSWWQRSEWWQQEGNSGWEADYRAVKSWVKVFSCGSYSPLWWVQWQSIISRDHTPPPPPPTGRTRQRKYIPCLRKYIFLSSTNTL